MNGDNAKFDIDEATGQLMTEDEAELRKRMRVMLTTARTRMRVPSP